MTETSRSEQQRILAARDSEFVSGEGGVADRIQAELVLRAEGWERSYRRADAEREALARLHEEATENAARYAAVIEKAKAEAELWPGSDTEAQAAAALQRVCIVLAIDAAAVLAEHDRVVAERAWGEGHQDGWSDRAHISEDRTRNPYRKGG